MKDQVVQRFATIKDLDKNKCTIEEREDYEPHIRNGFILFSGVDYEKILRGAEKEADIILWDGGNNDAPFIKPDLLVTVIDPLRPEDELLYYPSEAVARLADVFVVNKVNSASKGKIDLAVKGLKSINDSAKIVFAESVVLPDNPRIMKGKSALIIEDGPTITHGGMPFGAGTVAAKEYGIRKVVDARQYAVGTIKDVYNKYPKLGEELPAMGYSTKQIKDLQETINRAECDIVISATPTNLKGIIDVNKPIVQVYYELKPQGPSFDRMLDGFARKVKRQSIL